MKFVFSSFFLFLFSVELLDLEQLLAETKEKAEAERTVKARLAAIRQQLNDLRRADNDEPQGADSGSDTEDQPVTKSQIANLFSSSLQSAVSSPLSRPYHVVNTSSRTITEVKQR